MSLRCFGLARLMFVRGPMIGPAMPRLRPPRSICAFRRCQETGAPKLGAQLFMMIISAITSALYQAVALR